MENPVVVIVVVWNIQTDDNFLEKVLRQQQRADFSVRLVFRIHAESRLNINPFIGVVDDKINFLLHVLPIGTVGHHAYIHRVASTQKLIVDDVFHQMAGVILPVIQSGISQPRVGIIILAGEFEIGFSFYVVSAHLRDQE